MILKALVSSSFEQRQEGNRQEKELILYLRANKGTCISPHAFCGIQSNLAAIALAMTYKMPNNVCDFYLHRMFKAITKCFFAVEVTYF